MSDIYVVTSGCYSDYEINAVFKSREKAELYCECHEECDIEEWDFNDSNIYTVSDYVQVFGNINWKERKFTGKYYFGKFSIEDNPQYRNNTYVLDYTGDGIPPRYKHIEINLFRELPKNYSKMKVEYKWNRVMEDLVAELGYEFSWELEGNRKEIVEFIKNRFNVKEEEYEE